MSAGSSAYYQPTNLGVRTAGGSLIEPELDASVPAILFAEFLASVFFVFIGGSAVSMTGTLEDGNRSYLRILTIAIVDGLVFYGLIYMVMKLTRGRSGYFNSALTVSLCLVDVYLDSGHKVSVHVTRAVMHIIAQILGSLLGAIMIALLVPFSLEGIENISQPGVEAVSPAGTFFSEIFFTIFLVFMLLSVRNNENKKSSLILAFTMILVRLILFPTTGSTLNPSRSLALAIVGDGWAYAWIYLLAPIVGATIATAGFIWMHRQDME